MVSIADMISSALLYDTVMSRAMLRACGIPVPRPRPRRGSIVVVDMYADVAACFANHESPMDGRT